MHLPIYIYFELLSLLAAIIFYKGLNSFKLLVFIPLLLLTCFVDIAGDKLAALKISNHHVYNGYLLVSTPLYFYAFYKILNYTRWAKNLYIAVSSLILLFIILNLVFLQGYDKLNTYSLIIIEFILCLMSLLVLLKLFDNNDFGIMLQYHPYFWISGATLIFSVGTLTILGLHQFIETNHLQIDGKNLYRVLIPILNIILYGSYSYAFYLCNKLTRKL